MLTISRLTFSLAEEMKTRKKYNIEETEDYNKEQQQQMEEYKQQQKAEEQQKEQQQQEQLPQEQKEGQATSDNKEEKEGGKDEEDTAAELGDFVGEGEDEDDDNEPYVDEDLFHKMGYGIISTISLTPVPPTSDSNSDNTNNNTPAKLQFYFSTHNWDVKNYQNPEPSYFAFNNVAKLEWVKGSDNSTVPLISAAVEGESTTNHYNIPCADHNKLTTLQVTIGNMRRMQCTKRQTSKTYKNT